MNTIIDIEHRSTPEQGKPCKVKTKDQEWHTLTSEDTSERYPSIGDKLFVEKGKYITKDCMDEIADEGKD